MEKLSSDRFQAFVGGGIAGGSYSIHLLAGGADIGLMLLKFAGVLVAAAATGMFTLLGHDFYKYKVKNKLFKNGKEEEKDKAA